MKYREICITIFLSAILIQKLHATTKTAEEMAMDDQLALENRVDDHEFNVKTDVFDPVSESQIFDKKQKNELALERVNDYVGKLGGSLDNLQRNIDTRLNQMEDVVDRSLNLRSKRTLNLPTFNLI